MHPLFTHRPLVLFAKITVAYLDGLGECILVQKIVGK
jgi:hypothetical protein